jgi:hypothetical protein
MSILFAGQSGSGSCQSRGLSSQLEMSIFSAGQSGGGSCQSRGLHSGDEQPGPAVRSGRHRRNSGAEIFPNLWASGCVFKQLTGTERRGKGWGGETLCESGASHHRVQCSVFKPAVAINAKRDYADNLQTEMQLM